MTPPKALGLALTLLVGALTLISCERSEPATVTRTTLRVQGMTCNSCVRAITAELKKLPGVKEVQVSLEQKSAVILHDRGRAPVETLVASINKLGYKARSRGLERPTAP